MSFDAGHFNSHILWILAQISIYGLESIRHSDRFMKGFVLWLQKLVWNFKIYRQEDI